MDKEALLGLAAGKVEEKIAPVRDAAQRVRMALVVWEEHEKMVCEHEVVSAIAKALGVMEDSEDLSLERARIAARTQLAEAIAALPLGAVPGAGPAPGPEPVPASAPEPERESEVPERLRETRGPQWLGSLVASRLRDPTDEERERAERLIEEIEELVEDCKVEPMHALRLEPLLQALVAEVRLVSEPWSPTEDLHDRLTKKLSVLNALRKSAGLTKFIQGLAFGASGDWEKIARACRGRVARFDRDAAAPTPMASKKPVRPKPGEPVVTEEATETGDDVPPSDLPCLRALGLPIVVGGGRPLPEGQCEALGQKLGLAIEHHPIDHENPRAQQALLARIKAGKVGALILVEGYMRHATFAPLVRTLSARGVPYAYAGKGKVDAIEAACREIELAVRRTAGRR